MAQTDASGSAHDLGGILSQKDPKGNPSSEVPDGFEFLLETPAYAPPSDERARSRRGVLAVAAVVAVVAIALLALVAWPDQPETPETSPPTARASGFITNSPSLSGPEPSNTRRSPQSTDPEEGAALQVLEALDVKGRAPTTGYEREAYGPDWADVVGNGCDTRHDVLRRDLVSTPADPEDRCIIEAGLLLDPYSSHDIPFPRG
jgi:hypothetical protein